MDQLVRLFTSPWHFIVSLGRDPNARFWFLVSLATAGYVLFIVAMLVATAVHSTPGVCSVPSSQRRSSIQSISVS